jgi:hypothetical protein
VADLEEGHVDLARAQELASAVVPEAAEQEELSTLISEAVGDYMGGRQHKAWAGASVGAAAAGAWVDRPAGPSPRRRVSREFSLDVRARALAILGFIEADKSDDGAAAALRRDSEAALKQLRNPTPARFAIGATAADRALRLHRAEEALTILNQILRLRSLSDSQRGAAQALRATALRATGRADEANVELEKTAESLQRAGRPSAGLEAELERGLHMAQVGDGGAQALLNRIAIAAAGAGNDTVEARARLQLGVIAANAGQHREGAKQFELAAATARRAGNPAAVIVALRNAADELRTEHDLPGAERLLMEALAVPATAALTVDLAKAKYYLATVRHQQGRRDDASHLLDQAVADFERKLVELGADGSRQARDHVQAQLRKVAALREQMAR